MERIQPPEIFNSAPFGFSQVVTADPGKMVFISGQTALNKEVEIPEGMNFENQLITTLNHLRFSLSAAGATPSDVTMLRIYIVGYHVSYMKYLEENMKDFFGTDLPAQTWLGVSALALPDILIEIEAIAVI